MIHFSSLKRDYYLSKGDMTLEMGCSREKMSSCMIHLDHPQAVNEVLTISASIVLLACNRH